MSTKKKKEYSLYFKVTLETSVEISAVSLEEALKEAAGYGVTDLINIQGEHVDSSILVRGVQDNSNWGDYE